MTQLGWLNWQKRKSQKRNGCPTLCLNADHIHKAVARYIHFVDSTAPNKPGSQWQFERNILLYDKREGDLVLDILEGNRVGGVEFLKRL